MYKKWWDWSEGIILNSLSWDHTAVLFTGGMTAATAERDKGIQTLESGRPVICLIHTGGALLHHSLGRSSGMHVCGVFQGSPTQQCAIWTSFVEDRPPWAVEGERRIQNVLECCPGPIGLMAEFLYCSQESTSPNNGSQNEPLKTKTLWVSTEETLNIGMTTPTNRLIIK